MSTFKELWTKEYEAGLANSTWLNLHPGKPVSPDSDAIEERGRAVHEYLVSLLVEPTVKTCIGLRATAIASVLRLDEIINFNPGLPYQ